MLTNMYAFYQHPGWIWSVLVVIAVWEIVWKGMALWHSAKNKQTAWFICVLIFNTVGILPIIYLLWFKPQEEGFSEMKSVSVKRKKKK